MLNMGPLMCSELTRTYPWVIESYPVFHTVSKSLEAEVGIVVKVINHADVLPPSIFLLQNLSNDNNSHCPKLNFGICK